MTDKVVFFNDSGIQKDIDQVLKIFNNAINIKDEHIILKDILSITSNHSVYLDDNAPFAIKKYQHMVMGLFDAGSYSSITNDHTDRAFFFFAVVIYELRLKDIILDAELNHASVLVQEYILNIPKERNGDRYRLWYQEFAGKYASSLMNDPFVISLRDKQKEINRAVDQIEMFNRSLDVKAEKVADLERRFLGLENGIAVSGIAEAFRLMAKDKRKEVSKPERNVRRFSIAIITLIVGEVFLWLTYHFMKTPIGTAEIATSIIMLILQLMFVYFYRVNLHEYRSIKAQILQVDLRARLCEFIKAYSEFSKELGDKANNKETLEKFETLIFSGIVTKEDNIPSAYDGIDVIAQLTKALKKPG